MSTPIADTVTDLFLASGVLALGLVLFSGCADDPCFDDGIPDSPCVLETSHDHTHTHDHDHTSDDTSSVEGVGGGGEASGEVSVSSTGTWSDGSWDDADTDSETSTEDDTGSTDTGTEDVCDGGKRKLGQPCWGPGHKHHDDCKKRCQTGLVCDHPADSPIGRCVHPA